MKTQIVVFGLLAAIAVTQLVRAADIAKEYVAPLATGSVRIFDFGGIKLHAYRTNDAMADECFVLETDTNLVGIESPAFEVNLAEWKRYVEGLDKPLTDVLISYHPAGGRWYGDAASHATEAARKALTDGGTRQLTDYLKGAFGDEFNNDIPAIDHVLKSGANTVGGIEFIVTDDGDGYDIAIPAIKAVYIHMLGARVHSILASPEHIAATVAKLRKFKDEGCRVILSSHHEPETPADVDAKIAYLQKTRDILAASVGKDAFVAAMKEEFPGYAGESYLDMTANSFFPDGGK